MDFRLHEVHPALVHFPIALLPLSLGADFLGKMSDNRNLNQLGRQTIAPAAAAALFAGVSGMLAQEHVNLKSDTSMDALITHRNINIAATVGAGILAWRRLSMRPKETPSTRYLSAGFGLVAGLLYTGYLGGKLVYREGLGVEAADGVYKDPSVDYDHGDALDVARQTGKSLGTGVKHLAQELGEGKIAPTLNPRPSN